MYQRWLKADVDSVTFLRAMDALGAIADEYRLYFESESIDARALDPSNVAAAGVSVPVDYQTDHEQVTVGVDHTGLVRTASFFDLAGPLSIRLNNGEDHAHFSQNDPDLNNVGYIDETELYDPDSIRDDPDLPEPEYSTTATLDTMDLKAAVGAVSTGSREPLRLTAGGGSLRVTSRERGEGFENEWASVTEVSGERSQQTYSASYLSDIVTALPPNGEVTVQFGNDLPIRIETEYIWFVVSPRLTEDNE